MHSSCNFKVAWCSLLLWCQLSSAFQTLRAKSLGVKTLGENSLTHGRWALIITSTASVSAEADLN